MRFFKFFVVSCLFLSLGSGPSLAQELEMEVGLGLADITPEVGVPLAGYGDPKRRLPGLLDWRRRYPYATFFEPSVGVIDRIYSRAMIIKRGEKRMLFLSLGILGTDRKMVKQLAKDLAPHGFHPEDLFVSATHTHAGPGGVHRNFMLGLISFEKFNKTVYKKFYAQVMASIEMALENMQVADLFTGNIKTLGLQRNRNKKVGVYDPHARMLVAKNRKGEWLGGLINFAVHGTVLGSNNAKFSGDAPGSIARHMEAGVEQLNFASPLAKKPIFLFLQGAEGDVSPKYRDKRDEADSIQKISHLGIDFTSQLVDKIPALEKLYVDDFFSKRRKVWLGHPQLSIKACIKGKWRRFIWSRLGIPQTLTMPWKTAISMAKIGHISLFTIPGEPTATVGFNLQDAMVEMGMENPWVLGLTNDYLAYFITKKEFYEHSTESCSSLYRHRGARNIIRGHKKFFKEKRD